MEPIDETLNRLSDLDATFWPLVHLRPEQDEKMTKGLVALFALVFGGGAGIVCDFLFWGSVGHAPSNVLALPLGLSLFFFFVYSVTFARAWNRRAGEPGASR